MNIYASTLLLGTRGKTTRRRLATRLFRRVPGVAKEFLVDAVRFIRNSATLDSDDPSVLDARITANYHNIEKGLSLPNPRFGFGRAALLVLVEKMRFSMRRYNNTSPAVVTAAHTLKAYRQFHLDNNQLVYPFKAEIDELIDSVLTNYSGPIRGGTRVIHRAEILAAVGGTDESFFLSRHSVRNFTNDEVEMRDIEAAVRVAQKSPAVCNRQSGKVHVLADPKLIAEALKLQGGARGFEHVVNKVAAITVDTRNFWGAGERNQAWVDGGLFAMSFIFGLHARGLGSCCLNWSRSNEDSSKLRKLIGARDTEAVIMLIAIGHLPNEFVVPHSERKNITDVLRVVTGWHRADLDN